MMQCIKYFTSYNISPLILQSQFFNAYRSDFESTHIKNLNIANWILHMQFNAINIAYLTQMWICTDVCVCVKFT